jgi:hypothetical protein
MYGATNGRWTFIKRHVDFWRCGPFGRGRRDLAYEERLHSDARARCDREVRGRASGIDWGKGFTYSMRLLSFYLETPLCAGSYFYRLENYAATFCLLYSTHEEDTYQFLKKKGGAVAAALMLHC